MKDIPSQSDYKYSIVRIDSSEEEEKGGDRLEVFIYESELAKIKNWVLLHKNIETGGDLFGLWVDSHTAVVQIAIGPGKDCKRYETAFFQDLNYLAKAGGHLTEKHGLCNLGQWHSHHQLSLNKPSSGDENTVWGHMPTLGLSRYIVCIANIYKQRSLCRASLNCFLFERNDSGKQLPVLQGNFVKLKEASPVNEHSEISKVISRGAESFAMSAYSDTEDEEPTDQENWYRRFKSLIHKIFSSHLCKPLTFIGGISALLIVVSVVSVVYTYKENKLTYEHKHAIT